MRREVTRSKPIAFRVPVEKEAVLERRASVAGLSVGQFALRCTLEALALTDSGEEEGAFTPTADWREAQLPANDRTDETLTNTDENVRQARIDALRADIG